jgi:hypothetical protein
VCAVMSKERESAIFRATKEECRVKRKSNQFQGICREVTQKTTIYSHITVLPEVLHNLIYNVQINACLFNTFLV